MPWRAPLETCRDFSPDELERGLTLILADRVDLWLQVDTSALPREVPSFGLIGESSGMIAHAFEPRLAAFPKAPLSKASTIRKVLMRAKYLSLPSTTVQRANGESVLASISFTAAS